MSRVYRIRALALEGMTYNGVEPHEFKDGTYLKSFDPEAFNGLGYAKFTTHKDEAMTFPTPEAAIAFYRAQSKTRPLRAEDGAPNRPLTAFSVVIE